MRTRSTDRLVATADSRPSLLPVKGLRVRLAIGRRDDVEVARRLVEATLTAEVTERLRSL